MLTLLKPLLIVLFHESLLIVSVMSDVSIGALLEGMAVRYMLAERQLELAAVTSRAVTPSAEPTGIVP